MLSIDLGGRSLQSLHMYTTTHHACGLSRYSHSILGVASHKDTDQYPRTLSHYKTKLEGNAPPADVTQQEAGAM